MWVKRKKWLELEDKLQESLKQRTIPFEFSETELGELQSIRKEYILILTEKTAERNLTEHEFDDLGRIVSELVVAVAQWKKFDEHECRDCASKIWLEFLRTIDKRSQNLTFAKIKTWIWWRLRDALRSKWHREGREFSIEAEFNEEGGTLQDTKQLEARGASPDKLLQIKELGATIDDLLKRFPNQAYVEFFLFHEDEFTYDEIAELCETTVERVKMGIFHLRHWLRKQPELLKHLRE